MSNDLLFWKTRNYLGSAGERVELKPANVRGWKYRFPEDRRWRIEKDKFTALLHAAWELGKSGKDMDWSPVQRQPRPSIYKAWAQS